MEYQSQVEQVVETLKKDLPTLFEKDIKDGLIYEHIDKSIAYTWGSTFEERQMVFPCDRYMSDSDDVYFRAIDVKAPAPILFRWSCQ